VLWSRTFKAAAVACHQVYACKELNASIMPWSCHQPSKLICRWSVWNGFGELKSCCWLALHRSVFWLIMVIDRTLFNVNVAVSNFDNWSNSVDVWRTVSSVHNLDVICNRHKVFFQLIEHFMVIIIIIIRVYLNRPELILSRGCVLAAQSWS